MVAVYVGAAHFAYRVNPAAGITEWKSNFCVVSGSLYHPWKVKLSGIPEGRAGV